jgi:anti-sigma-K factor RskA
MAQSPHERDEKQRREALASLRELSERDTFATSALARVAQRATDHLAARDAIGPGGETDRIELWGRRIGRALSLVAFVALAIYLYVTHFR